MTKPDYDSFIFIVDTEQYSGNFERAMCAYITGQLGECGAGNEYRILYNVDTNNKKRHWFDEVIDSFRDEHGCSRPVTAWETPGWYNRGNGEYFRNEVDNDGKHKFPAYLSVAIFLTKKPSDMMLDFMKERALKFPEVYLKEEKYGEKITITNIRLIEYTVVRKENEIKSIFP